MAQDEHAWSTSKMCQIAQSLCMDRLLLIVVLVVALEESGTGVDDDEVNAAKLLDFAADLLEAFGNFEDALDPVNVDLIAAELHLLAQGDPAHFCICGVLSGENKYTPLFDVEIAQAMTQRNVRREQECDRGFASASMASKRIYEAAL